MAVASAWRATLGASAANGNNVDQPAVGVLRVLQFCVTFHDTHAIALLSSPFLAEWIQVEKHLIFSTIPLLNLVRAGSWHAQRQCICNQFVQHSCRLPGAQR